LLDFRYNTQEEIDKLNDEMTITSDLDDIIKQTNDTKNNENIDNENINNNDFSNEKEFESDFEDDID
jgi:hypothetical protein